MSIPEGNIGFWIVGLFMYFALAGMLVPISMFRGMTALGQFFARVKYEDWQMLEHLGWPEQEPKIATMGVQHSYARLQMRLLVFGCPPQLNHVKGAQQFIRQYRLAVFFTLLPQVPIILGGAAVFGAAFIGWIGVFFGAVIVLNLLILQATPWPVMETE
ncbi:MAG: hypothetical protein N4A70_16995 [Pelagimonas sp.]|nr:hypothetical protein [Pelagimonas sp.]